MFRRKETTATQSSVSQDEQFKRWMRETQLWTGADYLWLNRYRELYRAFTQDTLKGGRS